MRVGGDALGARRLSGFLWGVGCAADQVGAFRTVTTPDERHMIPIEIKYRVMAAEN